MQAYELGDTAHVPVSQALTAAAEAREVYTAPPREDDGPVTELPYPGWVGEGPPSWWAAASAPGGSRTASGLAPQR